MASAQSHAAWQQFLTRIDEARARLGCGEDADEEPWFRGMSCTDYKLMPSLFRAFASPNDDATWDRIWGLESDLFWEFTARARELHAMLDNDWDYLFAMQHFGTPTRLLDWTEVLGVAVYFAIVSAEEKGPPPCVWVLNPFGLNRESTGNEHADLFAPENIGWDEEEGCYYKYSELLVEEGMDFDWPLAIYPRQRNPRLHAQRAWFTMHGDEFIPLDDMENAKSFLEKVELPLEALPAARRFLDHAGINHYLLFADLENLSRFLREKFELGRR